MGYVHSERLSALDATFLDLEDESVHMHVGAVAIFDAGPLVRSDGSLDFERLRGLAGPALARAWRFRQRLEWIPVFGHPVWVDDARFNLDYHLRHTALPEPGDERQLKRLAGRIFSQKLDRSKPLWEMWLVEGLEGGRFAAITKVHHCMLDGVSGVDLLAALLDPAAAAASEADAGQDRWLPRPAPSRARLLAGELERRASLPARLAREAGRALADPRGSLEAARDTVGGVREFLGTGLDSASNTPLNGEIGPHRRFDWVRMDLGAVKEVRARLGGTVNDVVLAVVAGAVRSFLTGRGARVDDLDFRAQVPVNLRRAAERGRFGNQVALLLARLPVDEPDPRKRLERVTGVTRALKRSHQVQGGELLERIGDWTGKELLSAIARLAAGELAYNLVVTNVPGPPTPVELAGAPLREIYPLVPLFRNQAVGLALFSYTGSLFWGLNADWDAMPDLHDLALALEAELETLRKL
jgi:diacylglycerol O-acyltransferase / wax synthase